MGLHRKKHEEHENHERWLVSYADFITLLFAFFVVMYATSTNNEEKQKKFEESIKMNLNLSQGGGSSSQNGGQMSAETLVPELRQPVEGFPRHGGPEEVQDYVGRKLNKSLGGDEKESITKVHHDLVGARIALAASSFFPTGSPKLKRSSLKTLDKVADILKQTDRKVIIEGHTDDTPVSGGEFDSNWELASLRATSVVRYLVKYHNIDPKRLAAISYADQRPLVPNDSEANRAKNRRIEVLIVTDDKLNNE
jgi:chemotaxis protein MotB